MIRGFDAIIVGAGPAGSAAAIGLARAGWCVALVERQQFPRRKVCGECIAASNLPLLDALGVGPAFAAAAGPALHQASLLHRDAAVTAALPAAASAGQRWGRALARETLDTLLRDQAQVAGAVLLQPWSVRSVQGAPGNWHCGLRAVDAAQTRRLHAPVLIDAHGSWERLAGAAQGQPPARRASDLFAFKANFTGATLPEGVISVLALDGGYGGMVVADRRLTTVACCVRRDRLDALRRDAPGVRAGAGRALKGASRDGPWLASGPIRPGVRVRADDQVFRIGNAAGEAHPILGEGISMALQSAALLCSLLLEAQRSAGAPGQILQPEIQRRYAADWRRSFAPRMQVAGLFAHAAMRPRPAAWLMSTLQVWPGLLTAGARWGGKVQTQPNGAQPAS